VDPRPAIAAGLGVEDPGVVAGEVAGVEPAAAGRQVRGDRARDLAFVEVPRAGLGEPLQGPGEAAEPHHRRRPAPLAGRREAVGQIAAPALLVARQDAALVGDPEGRVPVGDQPALGERDRGLEALRPAAAAEGLQRGRHAVDQPRHRDRVIALQVAVLGDGRPAEEVRGGAADQRVVGRVEAGRRDHAAVDGKAALLAGDPDQHEAAAADPAHPGLDRADREAGGDRGVDRVAAGGQHPGADLGGEVVLAGHQAALGLDRGLADLPMLDHRGRLHVSCSVVGTRMMTGLERSRNRGRSGCPKGIERRTGSRQA